MAKYQWKRFWCPRAASFATSGDGFLYDPDSKYGGDINPLLNTLPDYSHVPCVVMLGQPGSGKSHEFREERDRLKRDSPPSGHAIHFVDLREYQTDARLVSETFHSPTVREWISGTHCLHLLFDSLDEGRLEIRNIASLLAGQLKLLKPHAHRLHLRIACRTAEWPTYLEEQLMEIWETDDIQIVELAPLRELDVRSAAEVENLDPGSFLSTISSRRASPFATNPLGLRFLLGIYRSAGDLPSTEFDLYEQGCLRLCDESSNSRKASGHSGSHTAEQRLEIAGRIAATTVFCGRNTVELARQFTDLTDEAIPLPELTGGTECLVENFEVTEAGVRETLSTMLFSGRGAERMGFAHWSYAEFLAARYVSRRRLDDDQIRALMFHTELENKVIPQLAETAAWVATRHKAVFERMLSGDPQTLLRSDVATADDTVKTTLIAALLNGLRAETLDNSDWKLRTHYSKLAHAGLPALLEPVLLNRGEPTAVRTFAVSVAEECREIRLLDRMTELVLDQTEDYQFRKTLAYAVVRMDDEAQIKRLLPLALGKAGPDPDDDLRGVALQGLWPRRLISSRNFFISLRPVQRHSYVGAYRAFLQTIQPSSFQPQDLCDGLRWCCDIGPATHSRREFTNAIETIVKLSLAHLDTPEVMNAVADFVLASATQYLGLPIDSESSETITLPNRRQLVETLVPRIDDIESVSWMLMGRAPFLVRDTDFNWLLQQSSNSRSPSEQHKWAHVARRLFREPSHSALDAILTTSEFNPVVAHEFADVIGPIILDSHEAELGKQSYLTYLELEEQHREQDHELEPTPNGRIGDCLNRFDQGDLLAWWQLTRELQLKTNDRFYSHDFEHDLTTLPGWIASTDEIKSRILRAAKRYVLQWSTAPERWIGTQYWYWPDIAGVRAFALVYRHEPSFIDDLTTERWRNWGAIILSLPTSSGIGGDSEALQKQLTSRAFDHVPQTIIKSLKTLINREAQSTKGNLFVLRRVEQCTSSELTTSLFEMVRTCTYRPQIIVDLFEELMRRDRVRADRLLWLYVIKGFFRSDWTATVPYPSARRRVPPIRKRNPRSRVYRTPRSRSSIRSRAKWQKDVSRKLAVVLWVNGDRRWERLSPLFYRDKRFFRAVICDICHERRENICPPQPLIEDELVELLILLAKEFPEEGETPSEHASFRTPTDSVREFRSNVLSQLINYGTPSSYKSFDRLIAELPDLDYLRRAALSARRAMLMATWRPPTISSFRELSLAPSKRLVRSERELQRVIVESLCRLQDLLRGETPAVRDIWDNTEKDQWKPINENDFSDYVKRHLESDLRNCGIVSLREVEIRHGREQPGERTDIYVTATVSGVPPKPFDSVHVILEVKGCWHSELQTAMESQLKNRYLKNNACQHGIYLVGWFACNSWSSSDKRKHATPNWSTDEARKFFRAQSAKLTDEVLLEAFVLDSALN